MTRATSTLAVAIAAVSAQGQEWTIVRLHPAGTDYSEVWALDGLRQIGIGGDHGGVWQRTAESWTPLTGSGQYSTALAAYGGMQAGSRNSRAAIWYGTPESFMSLHPEPSTGAISSGAVALCGDMQVGNIGLLFDAYHAALWRGTPSSFVDLHPMGATRSWAFATDGTLQGGSVRWTNIDRAAIWHGSPESVVNLSPTTTAGYSQVAGMVPGIQVGWVDLAGARRAALWRGTPESFVDMSPGGVHSSFFGTTGRVHVGRFAQMGATRAGINFGTPISWVSLHEALPAPYTSFSEARAVHQEGPTIYVGGWATNTQTFHHEAILWIGPDPCYANCDGSTASPVLNVADFTCFLQRFASGDAYANCDESTTSPVLNVADFTCFLQRFAAGCP